MKTLKLQIELVPESIWGLNFRKQVRQCTWVKIRKKVAEEAGNKCQVCGKAGKLNCHELWSYDEKWSYDGKKGLQRLKGFQAVCQMCHHVKHYGMSRVLARQGKLKLEDVDKHFLKINKVSPAILKKHLQEAEEVFVRRSKIEWAMEFGKWFAIWEKDQVFETVA